MVTILTVGEQNGNLPLPKDATRRWPVTSAACACFFQARASATSYGTATVSPPGRRQIVAAFYWRGKVTIWGMASVLKKMTMFCCVLGSLTS